MARTFNEETQNAWFEDYARQPDNPPGQYLNDDTGKAGHDGFTVVARRPWGAHGVSGGDWRDPDDAKDHERMMEQFDRMGSTPGSMMDSFPE